MTSGKIKKGQRIVLFGRAGHGKTSLVSTLSQIGKKALLLDLDDGSSEIDGIDRVSVRDGLNSWESVRAALASATLLKGYDVVAIDTATVVQRWAAKSIMDESDVTSLEKACGGYGKGYRRLYEYMVDFLADCDHVTRSETDVVFITHSVDIKQSHAGGDDYHTAIPDLYEKHPNTIASLIRGWADHLFFVGEDVSVTDSKATGAGSLSIWHGGQPSNWSKSRRLPHGSMPYPKGSADLWHKLFAGDAK